MSEATSKTCAECGGRGFRGVKGGLCATCNGTGIVTTGEVVGVLPSTPEPSCALCGDTGTVHFQGGDENCAACHARLVLDTEPPLPSTPDPVNPGELPSQTITVTHNGAATAPFPDRYIGPQPDTPTRNGTCDHCGGRGKVLGPLDEIQTCGVCDGTGDEWIPKSILDSAPRLHVECACDECAKPRDVTGHDGCERGLERANATIAEQSAEIERLRERVNGLEQLHASWADGSLAEVTAERNALRAAVDHLKGERDTLRSALEIAAARSDSQNESISYFEQESASHDAALAELTTDRDTLRLEVQRLKDLNFEAQDRYAALEAERDALKEHPLRAIAERQREDFTRLLDEANDRAEKYLRVIKAKDLELFYTVVARSAALKACAAMAEAGLPLHVIEKPDHE